MSDVTIKLSKYDDFACEVVNKKVFIDTNRLEITRVGEHLNLIIKDSWIISQIKNFGVNNSSKNVNFDINLKPFDCINQEKKSKSLEFEGVVYTNKLMMILAFTQEVISTQSKL